MPKYNLEAIVLKNSNYKDSDKIYSLLTREKGKVTAFGKGVRKISSKRGSGMDTLNHVKVSIYESSSGYKSINEVKVLNSFRELKASHDNHADIYYMLELVFRFLEDEHSNYALFDLLERALVRLSMASSPTEKTLVINIFEMKLMQILGYQLHLDGCVSCQTVFGDDWSRYKFNVVDGGFVCEKCMRGGISISQPTALLLNYIWNKSQGNSSPKSENGSSNGNFFSKDTIQTADDLLKFYIRETLEDSFRSVRVFGG